MAAGAYACDLNGNIGHPEEYTPGSCRTQVGVWLVADQVEQLQVMVAAHAQLQPLGFGAWASYLGKALGYPECCVEAYIDAVRHKNDRESYWREKQSAIYRNGGIITGFAPCRAECPAAHEATLEHLTVARQLNLLDVECATTWMKCFGMSGRVGPLLERPYIVDFSTHFADLRSPRRPSGASPVEIPKETVR